MASATQIVKIKVGKNKFEVITNRGTVTAFRENRCEFHEVLASDTVFKDVKKGDIAAEETVKGVFSDFEDDMQRILQHIIMNGDLEKSAEERKAEVKEKRQAMIYFINKNYCDPKTKLPHPSVRIENCMKECKIRVDPIKNHEKQAEDAVKKMRGKLAFEKIIQISGSISIPLEYSGTCSNIVRSFGCSNESWGSANVTYKFDLSNADFCSLQNALNKPTNDGHYTISLDGGEDNVTEEKAGKKKKEKKKKRPKKQTKKKKSEN